jgi:toxin ParE1/3/4
VTAKAVIPRAKAQADVEQAIDHYTAEAGAEIALNFIDALEQAYAFIGDTPAGGSPRWAMELSLPGLRSTRMKRFPWLIFYTEQETHVDVWRVLHARRDMPNWVTDLDDG